MNIGLDLVACLDLRQNSLVLFENLLKLQVELVLAVLQVLSDSVNSMFKPVNVGMQIFNNRVMRAMFNDAVVAGGVDSFDCRRILFRRGGALGPSGVEFFLSRVHRFFKVGDSCFACAVGNKYISLGINALLDLRVQSRGDIFKRRRGCHNCNLSLGVFRFQVGDDAFERAALG